MSVIELATLLKQFEQAVPGSDAYVQMTYDEWDFQQKTMVERTAVVAVRDFKWGTHGAVIEAEDVS